MSHDIEKIFWQLLRAGLWGDPAFLNGFESLTAQEWVQVVKLGGKSGTLGIVADGIELLPDQLRPPMTVMSQLIRTKVNLMALHAKHNATICEIVGLFEQLGVSPVLMKGQSAAIYYDKPESRTCGDIDLYIGVDQVDRVIDILKQQGITYEEEIEDNEKHVVFFYKNLGVELHRYSTYMIRSSVNDYYQQWWSQGVEQSSCIYFTPDGKLSVAPIEDARAVRIARTNQHVFFLFYHVYLHFMGMQVQFRQFCDLARALYVNHDKLDLSELQTVLDKLGLMNAWQSLGCFLHQYLGLGQQYIPFYNPDRAGKADLIAQRLHDKILFVKPSKWKRPQNVLGSKIYTYVHHMQAFFEVFKIFPKESLYKIWHSTTLGLRVLFTKEYHIGTHEKYRERMARDKDPLLQRGQDTL